VLVLPAEIAVLSAGRGFTSRGQSGQCPGNPRAVRPLSILRGEGDGEDRDAVGARRTVIRR